MNGEEAHRESCRQSTQHTRAMRQPWIIPPPLCWGKWGFCWRAVLQHHMEGKRNMGGTGQSCIQALEISSLQLSQVHWLAVSLLPSPLSLLLCDLTAGRSLSALLTGNSEWTMEEVSG